MLTAMDINGSGWIGWNSPEYEVNNWVYEKIGEREINWKKDN